MGSSVRFESVGSTATLISMLEKSVLRLVDISRKRPMQDTVDAYRPRPARGEREGSLAPAKLPQSGVITHGQTALVPGRGGAVRKALKKAVSQHRVQTQ